MTDSFSFDNSTAQQLPVDLSDSMIGEPRNQFGFTVLPRSWVMFDTSMFFVVGVVILNLVVVILAFRYFSAHFIRSQKSDG